MCRKFRVLDRSRDKTGSRRLPQMHRICGKKCSDYRTKAPPFLVYSMMQRYYYNSLSDVERISLAGIISSIFLASCRKSVYRTYLKLVVGLFVWLHHHWHAYIDIARLDALPHSVLNVLRNHLVQRVKEFVIFRTIHFLRPAWDRFHFGHLFLRLSVAQIPV